VYVGVDVPLRRLLLFALVFSATHNGLVSKCLVTSLNTEIVRIQRIPSARIQQPRVHRLPLE
jgi:hypothetical protein